MGRGLAFSLEEDVLITKAYVAVAHGYGGDQGGRWDKIFVYFRTVGMSFATSKRNGESLSNRWSGVIKREVSHFDLYVQAVLDACAVSVPPDQVVELALQYFRDNEKREFGHLPCWNILRKESGWKSTPEALKGHIASLDSDPEIVNTPQPETPVVNQTVQAPSKPTVVNQAQMNGGKASDRLPSRVQFSSSQKPNPTITSDDIMDSIQALGAKEGSRLVDALERIAAAKEEQLNLERARTFMEILKCDYVPVDFKQKMFSSLAVELQIIQSEYARKSAELRK